MPRDDSKAGHCLLLLLVFSDPASFRSGDGSLRPKRKQGDEDRPEGSDAHASQGKGSSDELDEDPFWPAGLVCVSCLCVLLEDEVAKELELMKAKWKALAVLQRR